MTSEENPPVDDTAPAATEDAENPEVGDANPPKSGEPGPFALEVDPQQQYKAKELKICSFARPHMRAFHVSVADLFLPDNRTSTSMFTSLMNQPTHFILNFFGYSCIRFGF
jgi:hypothetical protein